MSNQQYFYAVFDLHNDMDIFKFGKIDKSEMDKYNDLLAPYGEGDDYPFVGDIPRLEKLLQDWGMDDEEINKVKASVQRLLNK
jgi:hypothetical protein